MVVFHRDPLGIATFLAVQGMILFANAVLVRYVIEYGRHDRWARTVQQHNVVGVIYTCPAARCEASHSVSVMRAICIIII